MDIPSRGRARGRGRNFHSNRQERVDSDSLVSTTANTPQNLSGTATPVQGLSHLSSARFDDLKGQIDQRLLDAIPFEHMTEAQAATLPIALTGRDLLAQAKTGTGKTLGFLIPSIQKLTNLPKAPSQSDISVLVLSPTRELALQIEKEASMLLKNFPGLIGVQHVVGGTNIKSERKRLRSQRKDILIATPGRLLDHLQNNEDGVDIRASLHNLNVLVVDEADRMLDMGFRNELEKIIKCLPDPMVRQSLFFSATIPSFVHQVAKLKPDHAFISTLKEEELNTHQHVPQEFKIVNIKQCLPMTLLVTISEALRFNGDHKVILFLPTARATSLAAEIFRTVVKQNPAFERLGPIYEIHSRKSQSARTKTMADFRTSKCGLLFSSDVTARGVDVPGISLVVQLGLPSSSEQYIHRLGRTARAGKEGRGVLILADFEAWFLHDKEVKRLPIKEMDVPAVETETSVNLANVEALVDAAMASTDETVKTQAYQAHLGYYKSYLKKLRWSDHDLVAKTNDYAFNTLLWKGEVAPPLLAKTVGMMGLRGVRGLNVVKALPNSDGGAQPRKRKDPEFAEQGRPDAGRGRGRP